MFSMQLEVSNHVMSNVLLKEKIKCVWYFSIKRFLYSSLVRRLDPSERPLQMVYDYLTTMGYDDPVRVQQEAANSDLSCMIRFYTGEYTKKWQVVLFIRF